LFQFYFRRSYNKYNISRHFLKTLLHYRVKHKIKKNAAIALPILDDTAVLILLNFYDDFVNF